MSERGKEKKGRRRIEADRYFDGVPLHVAAAVVWIDAIPEGTCGIVHHVPKVDHDIRGAESERTDPVQGSDSGQGETQAQEKENQAQPEVDS
jgi:hypothetical protein